MWSVKDYPKDCIPLRIAQEKCSDMQDRPMATLVHPTLRQLVESAEHAPRHFLESIHWHVRRVRSNHEMKVWVAVMCFSLEWIVVSARARKKASISVERVNDLLKLAT